VDELLVAEGRLHRLASASDLELGKRAMSGRPATRDPAELLDVLLTAL
jgi:hypothetical protein